MITLKIWDPHMTYDDPITVTVDHIFDIMEDVSAINNAPLEG